MRFRVGAVVLAGALFGAAALLPAVSEGRGGNHGDRGRCGQTQCRQQRENCPQDPQRVRDGSCGNPDCPKTGARQDCPGPQGTGCRGCAGPGQTSGTK